MKLISKIALLSILLFPLIGYSQYLTEDKEEDKKPISNRIYFGGNFGLSFGSVTYIEIAPIVGYRVTEKFSTGVGLNYTYYKEEFTYSNGGAMLSWDYRSKIYGGKIFTEYLLLDNLDETLNINLGRIIAHAEIEELNVDTYTYDQYGYMTQDGRKWITSVLIGGGISQPIGQRSSINLLILYNLTEETFTPYSNPVIRLNFNF